MIVNIREATQKDYLEAFGITEEEVNEAVTTEDSKKVLRHGNLTEILFLKKMAKGYYLLVDSSWKNPNLSISSVFKIFPHTIEEVPNDPLLVLQDFAQKFGYVMIIGNQYNKFIYETSIPVPRIENWQQYILNPRILVKLQNFGKRAGEQAMSSYNIRFRHGIVNEPDDWVDIAMAYALDSLEYIRYINENEPGSVPVPAGSD